MITNGKKWHYLAVKNFSVSLRGITSKHNGNFYYLNFFTNIVQKKNLKNMKKYVMIMIIMQKCLKKTAKY